MLTPLHYGMFVQPGMISAAKGEGHQFGMYASCQGGSQALLRHSHAEEIRFACSPFAAGAIRKETSGTKARVEDLVEFLRHGQDGTNAWIDMAGDSARPFRFRRRIGGTYPIGVVQHSVSYGHCLHSWFLPLLLGDVRAHDTILCTSAAAKESIRRILGHVAKDLNAEHGTELEYKGRLDVVPAGVDVDHFRPIDRREARAAFGIPEGDTVVLFAGRVSAQDKADLLPFLRAFADLARTRPSLRLVLAGGARGDEMKTLGAIIADLEIVRRVMAPGLVPHGMLPKLYSAADVFVSPADSLPETFGLTCVEAMACGVPVVASDWNGYKDTVAHGGTGLLVPTLMSDDLSLADDLSEWSMPQGELVDVYAAAQATIVDMEAMKKAIATLADDPSLRRRMGEAGRKRTLEKYAWSIVIRMYDDLFDELRATPATGREDRPYTRTRLAETFSHYPTRMLDDATMIESLGHDKIVIPRPQLGIVTGAVAGAILKTLSTGPMTIDDLASKIDSKEVRFHAAWLLKNGYAKAAS